MANVVQDAIEIVDVGAKVRSNFVSRTSALTSKYSSRLSDFKAKLEERKADMFLGKSRSKPITIPSVGIGARANPLQIPDMPIVISSDSSSGSDISSEEDKMDQKEVIDLLWPPRKRAKLDNDADGEDDQDDIAELLTLDPLEPLDPEQLSLPKKDDAAGKIAFDPIPVSPFKKVFQQDCGQCKSSAKYRCPGCGEYTCSLACCINHKRISRCTGRRRAPGDVHISKNELTVNAVLNDIRFLDHVKRFYRGVERRDLTKFARKRCLRNVNLRMMHAAKERGTHLRFLPEYMERSRRNTSKFIYLTDTFLWHVELVFGLRRKPCSKVPEKTTLSELLDDVWLQQFEHEGLRLTTKPFFKRRSDLRFLLEIPLCSAKLGGGFLEVVGNEPLREILSGFIVLEFPIFHVVYAEDLPKYKCVTRDALSSVPELLEKLDDLHGFDCTTQAVQRKRKRVFKRRREEYGDKDFKRGENVNQQLSEWKDDGTRREFQRGPQGGIVSQDSTMQGTYANLPRTSEDGRRMQELPRETGNGIIEQHPSQANEQWRMGQQFSGQAERRPTEGLSGKVWGNRDNSSQGQLPVVMECEPQKSGQTN